MEPAKGGNITGVMWIPINKADTVRHAMEQGNNATSISFIQSHF
jgi:hypothetical protein